MSNETLFQEAVQSTQATLETREIKVGKVRALLGDVAGNLTGPSGVPWVLARLYGDASRRVEAYNGTPLVPTFNMPVELWVRYENGRATRYDIKGYDTGMPWVGYTPGQNGALAAHAISHELGRGDGLGGWDAVNVYERMVTSLRPNAQATPDLTIAVSPGYYNIDGQEYYFAGGSTGAFTPPGSGSEYDVVTLDTTGTLNIEPGALTSPPVTFTLTAGRIPIAAVYLTAGQTAITEDNLLDIRPFLSLATPGAAYSLTVEEMDGTPTVSGVVTIKVSNGTLTDDGGGVVTIVTSGTPHDLLDGSVDQDTVATSVLRGSLVVGNSTPKWGALVIGASGRILQSNGTDPSWVALSGDATIAAGGAVTLANTAVTPGTYGDATHVAQVTVDSKGRVTAASDVAISAGHVIENEGTPLTQRANLNFVGSGVDATDDAGNNASVVTVPAWSILANGDPVSPAIVFTPGGDVIAVPF